MVPFKLLHTPWLWKFSTPTSAWNKPSFTMSTLLSWNNFRTTAFANPRPRYSSCYPGQPHEDVYSESSILTSQCKTFNDPSGPYSVGYVSQDRYEEAMYLERPTRLGYQRWFRSTYWDLASIVSWEVISRRSVVWLKGSLTLGMELKFLTEQVGCPTV
jgi:hypothetical protein